MKVLVQYGMCLAINMAGIVMYADTFLHILKLICLGLCCRFSPQRVACLCKGAIDLAAIKQQATDAAACEGTPAWDSFAVVPGTEDLSDKRQRVT